MGHLARWRWALFAATVAALATIAMLGPKYGQLQLAPDAEAFRRLVGGERARYVRAGTADALFAVFYGLFALGIVRRTLASRVGAWLVVAGAVFDEIENSLLIANVAAGSDLSDGMVRWMRLAGAAKFLTIGAGAVLFVGDRVLERRRRGTR